MSAIRIYEKKNAWTIRGLVNESFVPSTQQPCVLYWRLLHSIIALLVKAFWYNNLKWCCHVSKLTFSETTTTSHIARRPSNFNFTLLNGVTVVTVSSFFPSMNCIHYTLPNGHLKTLSLLLEKQCPQPLTNFKLQPASFWQLAKYFWLKCSYKTLKSFCTRKL